MHPCHRSHAKAVAAGKKGARTRARNHLKRSVAAKKAARTRRLNQK